jgi:hypothetical protein
MAARRPCIETGIAFQLFIESSRHGPSQRNMIAFAFWNLPAPNGGDGI